MTKKQSKRTVTTKRSSVKKTAKRQSSKVSHDVAKTKRIVKKNPDPTASEIMMSWVRATTEAIEAFDFEVCADYYKRLDWGWFKNFQPHGPYDRKTMKQTIPTEMDIRDEVSRMINTCIQGVIDEEDEQTSYMCSTGGLSVRAFKYVNPSDNWIWIGFCPVETLY